MRSELIDPDNQAVVVAAILGLAALVFGLYLVWQRYFRVVLIQHASGTFIGDPVVVALTVWWVTKGETVELAIRDVGGDVVHLERLSAPKPRGSGPHLRRALASFKPIPIAGRCSIAFHRRSGAIQGEPVEFDVRMPVVELAAAGAGRAAGELAGNEPRWGDLIEVRVSCSAAPRSGSGTVTLRRRDAGVVPAGTAWSVSQALPPPPVATEPPGSTAAGPTVATAAPPRGAPAAAEDAPPTPQADPDQQQRSVTLVFAGSLAPPEPGECGGGAGLRFNSRH